MAYDIQEMQARRPKFTDLVHFITTQARVALHPLFGELKEGTRGSLRSSSPPTAERRGKSIFATVAVPNTLPTNPPDSKGAPNRLAGKGLSDSNASDAFAKPCLFCQGNHSMAECKKMRRSLNKIKIDFLSNKGLCFSCLKFGHTSWQCTEKLSCEICSKTHPTVLHLKISDRPTPRDEACSKRPVSSGFVGTTRELHDCTGAGGADIILPIVPVKVKAVKGTKVVEAYAFLDPGSTATFCTESLMNGLQPKEERWTSFSQQWAIGELFQHMR